MKRGKQSPIQKGMYNCERENPIKGGEKKRSPTANRTVCPGWQQAKWWGVNEMGSEILWTARR